MTTVVHITINVFIDMPNVIRNTIKVVIYIPTVIHDTIKCSLTCLLQYIIL